MNIIPERLTFSGFMPFSFGYGDSPLGRLTSGLNTTVPHSGHFFSLSASSTPHFIQYIYIIPSDFISALVALYLYVDAKLAQHLVKVHLKLRLFYIAHKVDIRCSAV